MVSRKLAIYFTVGALGIGTAILCVAQPPFGGPPGFGFGPPGFGGPPGGPGGPGGPDREILKQFDNDKSGWLNSDERKLAREFLKSNPSGGRGQRGPDGGRGDRREDGRLGENRRPPFDRNSEFNRDRQRPGEPRTPESRPSEQPPSEARRDSSAEETRPSNGNPSDARESGSSNQVDSNQRQPDFDRPEFGRQDFAPPGFGPGGFPPPGLGPDGFGPPGFGPPGFGPPNFGPPGFGPPGFGPPGMDRDRPEAKPGMKVTKDSVKPLSGDLYDPSILRTIFLDFEHDDWESELEDFHGTDVDVPATVTIDGESYANCGIRFRGASSYGMVPRGYKRSLNISVDMANEKQRVQSYKTLNLLNNASDSSMMSTVLYSMIARQYIAAPKANFVRVVINGEEWGIYTNVEQFNKEFVEKNFGTSEGGRWKVSGSPQGGGGLDYRGEDPEMYDRPYERKSGGKDATKKLIELCRVLDQTPVEDLPKAIEPIVDIDNLLWFLALDIGLQNTDGYWIRASDYSIYLDDKSKFHFIPHDMNEAFRAGMGPGMGGPGGPRGPGGPGGPMFDPRGRGEFAQDRDGRRPPSQPGERPEEFFNRGGRPEFDPRGGSRGGDRGSQASVDPLHGIDDWSKPLRSKILAVPEYRERYLANLKKLANDNLDWNSIAPFLKQQVSLIDEVMNRDTRSLASYTSFRSAVDETVVSNENTSGRRGPGGPGGPHSTHLKSFIDSRREYLLNYQPSDESPNQR